MWIKKAFLLFILFICTVSLNFAQEDDYVPEEKEPIKDRIRLGGGMSLWFGNETFVFLAPQLSYKVRNNLYAGVGLSYTYYSLQSANYSFHFGGASLFSRYFLFDQLFLHAELETLRGEWDQTIPDPFNIYNLYGGVGYSQSLGGAASVNMTLLYNFNQGPYSPYQNPQFRLGFNLGL